MSGINRRLDKMLAAVSVTPVPAITLIYKDGSRREVSAHDAILEIDTERHNVVGVDTELLHVKALLESMIHPISDEAYARRLAMLTEN